MDTTLKYIKRVPGWKTILGITIAFISLYLIISGAFFGIVPIAYSVLLLQTSGTEINLQNKTYRKIYSILGLSFGKWIPLPEAEYVSIFATTETTKVWASSATANITDAIYMINIFYNTNQKIEVCNAYSHKEAFDIGAHVAFTLDTDLLDATENKNFKWMDRNLYIETGKIVYID
ncbi:hypothetical protein [uncultured Lacinutrix sp.]|uniref:hypothetical protein n=1 Tax=uncultured Lacinutrix sp. TaxID=574032 RepID=UPI0026282A40|nr:hypothetical protein [uncultured Lacinutrix sp.]